MHLVDLDNAGRSESIAVLDPATSAVLINPQTVSHFAGGEYLTWYLRGNVEFLITNVTGPNACVSGLFFGATATTAAFVATDPTTQGNWQGVYGADGENVLGSSTANYPPYAQVSVTGNSSHTWAPSTTAVSA